MLLDAITSSGYPLQGQVIEVLQSTLLDMSEGDAITEEWSFIDADSSAVRNLDVLAIKRLADVNDRLSYSPEIPTNPRALIRHEVDFMIECKRSELPFVFFTREFSAPRLPVIVGLPNETISLGRDGEAAFFEMSVADLIDFGGSDDLDLKSASAVAKATRKGKGLELSGEDVFRSLTMPIRKALKYHADMCNPREGRLYHDARFVYPVVVIDAPMYQFGKAGLSRISAARLVITEPDASERIDSFNAGLGLDFVSFDYLATYLRLAEARAEYLAQRLDSMALAAILGQAIISIPAEDEDPDRADFDDPLSQMTPPLLPDAAEAWIRKRFIEIHQPQEQQPEG